jgi:glycerol-3-phosphate acyltransferase PlsY
VTSDDLVGLLIVVAAYAAGAVPWGFIFGRLLQGVDLRRIGSGGTGATNVLRALGWQASLAVLLLDFAKGLIPVLLARGLGLDEWWVAATAVAAVAGHCWSPLLGFRGGKGMATGAGAAVALLPAVLLIVPVMVLIVVVTRYVSLASLVGSLAVAAIVAAFGLKGDVPWSVAVAVGVIAGIVVLQHQGNIQRLLAGTERRIGEPA